MKSLAIVVLLMSITGASLSEPRQVPLDESCTVVIINGKQCVVCQNYIQC